MIALGIGRSLPEITGYEPTIYSVFPLTFWVSFGIALAGFCAVLASGSQSTTIFVGAFLGLVLTAVTLSGLPHLRGYEEFGRGDVATHIADLQNLLASGRLGDQDFYPAAKLYAATLILLGGIPPDLVELVAKIVLGATYALGSVLLARRLLNTSQWDGLVLGAAVIPVAGAYAPSLVPAAFGVSLAPLTLALLLPASATTASVRLSRIVLTLSVAFVHPLVAILILGAVIWVRIAYALPSRAEKPGSVPNERPDNAFLLLLVSLLAWITAFSIFDRELVIIRNAVLAGVGGAAFESSLELASRAGFNLLDSLLLALRVNLGVALVMAVGLPAAMAALIARRWKGSRRLVIAVLGLCLTLLLGTVVNGLLAFDLDVFRFIHMLTLVVPVLLALVASVFLAHRRAIAAAMVVVIGLASVPFVIPSRFTYEPSDHIPPGELEAVTWLGNQRPSGTVMSFLSLRRIGERAFPDPTDPRRGRIVSAIQAPDHFGQFRAIHLPPGTEPGPIWLVVFESDRYAYLDLWRAADRFTQNDFAMLDEDLRISRAYANSAAAIYLVDYEAFQISP